MILTAVFADKVGFIHCETATFFNHFLALGIVAVFTTSLSYALYTLYHLVIPTRVSEVEEEIGLDLNQHEESLDLPVMETKNQAPHLHAVST